MRMSMLERQFREFHRDNPHVYRLFDKFTRQVLATGRGRYSADAILHRVRWHTAIETRSDSFKINNNWAAFYARMWMHDNPAYKEFFETRVQRSGAAVPPGHQWDLF